MSHHVPHESSTEPTTKAETVHTSVHLKKVQVGPTHTAPSYSCRTYSCGQERFCPEHRIERAGESNSTGRPHSTISHLTATTPAARQPGAASSYTSLPRRPGGKKVQHYMIHIDEHFYYSEQERNKAKHEETFRTRLETHKNRLKTTPNRTCLLAGPGTRRRTRRLQGQ